MHQIQSQQSSIFNIFWGTMPLAPFACPTVNNCLTTPLHAHPYTIRVHKSELTSEKLLRALPLFEVIRYHAIFRLLVFSASEMPWTSPSLTAESSKMWHFSKPSNVLVVLIVILVAVTFVFTRWTNISSPAPSAPPRPQPQEQSPHDVVSKTGKFAKVCAGPGS